MKFFAALTNFDGVSPKFKQNLLDELSQLKAKKPEGWKREARKILNQLAYIEDPYGEHEDRGTEARGRKIHKSDGCPSFDRMGDNSWP